MQKFSREQKIVLTVGVSLIALGAGFLTLQIIGIKAVGTWVPLLAGAIALALAVITRLPGFTFLGCLLIFGGGGLLFFVNAEKIGAANVSEAIFLLFFSVGFCFSSLLTRFIDKKVLLWPLFPGVAGLIVGILLLVL